jgi:uncharacterized protein YcbX
MRPEYEEEMQVDAARMNFLISQLLPREEHQLVRFRIGNVLLQRTIPCNRCEVTGVDQETGERNSVFQALKKLSKPHKDKPPILGEQWRVVRKGSFSPGLASEIEILKYDQGDGYRRDFEDIPRST